MCMHATHAPPHTHTHALALPLGRLIGKLSASAGSFAID